MHVPVLHHWTLSLTTLIYYLKTAIAINSLKWLTSSSFKIIFPWLFPDFLGFSFFNDQILKFPDYSLTLKKYPISLTFQVRWQPWRGFLILLLHLNFDSFTSKFYILILNVYLYFRFNHFCIFPFETARSSVLWDLHPNLWMFREQKHSQIPPKWFGTGSQSNYLYSPAGRGPGQSRGRKIHSSARIYE